MHPIKQTELWEDENNRVCSFTTCNCQSALSTCLFTFPSLEAQKVKHLPAMWETWVRSLGQEDPLEKEMATHSSTLAWKISWMKEPGRLQSMGSQKFGHDWVTLLSLFFDWWWLQATFWHNQKEEKGNIKRGSQEEGGHLWGQPAPMSWECLSHKRSVCLSCTEL